MAITKPIRNSLRDTAHSQTLAIIETKMQREEAKNILREIEFKKLSNKERLNLLEELWIMCDSEDWFDEEDLNFYSEEVRIDMIKNSKPENPSNPKYDLIIKNRLKGLFYGVKNDYLIDLLARNNIRISHIIGENEELEKCDCCEYRTITTGEDGLGEICSVCFWENLGESPNNMSLEQARKNFVHFGAMDKRVLNYIDPEGKRKYEYNC